MLLALETTNKIALTIAASAFIAFALISAFVLSKRSDDFPGKNGVKPFVIASLVLFVLMVASIEVFAKEAEEEQASGENAGQVENGGKEVAGSEAGEGEFSGDAAKGKPLYTSLGCISCHNLDESVAGGPGFGGLAGSEVKLADGSTVTADEEYLVESITDPDAKIVDGYTKGVMSAVIKPGQVSEQDAADLAAFIAQQ